MIIQDKRRDVMSDSHHDHHDHQEDNSVNVKVAIFFAVVIAAIIFIGLIN